jgi:4'-phosphopantetheinyl transferase
VWTIHAPAFDTAEAEGILSPAEKARAARYRFDEDRRRYIAGRASLRRILAERTGTPAGELAFEEPDGEKPRLGLTVDASGVFFNVSHSGDYTVIAVSDTAEVGIDIEEIRVDCPINQLARRYYAASEFEWLRNLPENKKLQGFYRLWTIKEAVLKCAGLGLSVPTQSIRVWLANDQSPTVTCSDAGHKALDGIQVRELRLVEHYASALAVSTDEEVGIFLGDTLSGVRVPVPDFHQESPGGCVPD